MGILLACNRVLIVIGWNEDVRKCLVIDAGRLIWREFFNWSRRSGAAFIPAFIVVYVIGREEVHRFKLPHAVLFDVFVFIGSFPPLRRFVQHTGLDDGSPASLGGLPIRLDRDHGLKLHMVEYLPILKFWKMMHKSAHAVLPYVHAAPANLYPAIPGKQVCSLIPLAFIEIVAVGVFEIGQGDEILRPADSAFEGLDLRLQLLQLRAKIFSAGLNDPALEDWKLRQQSTTTSR